jgi:hypothetical protein
MTKRGKSDNTSEGRARAAPLRDSGGLAASASADVPWSVPLAVDAIPDEGLHRDIVASPEACAGVAALAGVRSVSGLSAAIDLALVPVEGGDIVQVSGRVKARVGQTCVVTLEPIETDLDEPIDIAFAPAAAHRDAPAADSEARRVNVGDDLPEPLIGGMLDLGAIASEFLILGIDPYPRKAGVEFAPPEVENDTPHPFAALAALQKRPGGDKA